MGKPIYMIYRSRPTAAYWELTEEERNSFGAKLVKGHEKVGAKPVIVLDAHWSTERWFFAGVTEFPDIEAVQKWGDYLAELDHAKYVIVDLMLGTEWEAPS